MKQDSATEPLVSFRGAGIGYDRLPLLEGLDWQVAPGSLWGVIGPNGVGKTTLLKTLLGFLKPLKGTARLKRDLRVGYVKQRDTLNEVYPFSVFEMVLMGCYGQIPMPRRPGAEDRRAALEALERTGILELRDTPVRELSGGQKQRVLIARALASRPELIILDEPTNDMDMAGEQSVLALIDDIHQYSHAAVVMVSHLLNTVLQIAENFLFLKEGRAEVIARDELVCGGHLEDLYRMPVRILKLCGGGYAVLPSQQRKGGTPHVE